MTDQELKRARVAKNWTQKDAAKHLGVSQCYLSLLETGRRVVPDKMAQRFRLEYEMPATVLPLPSPGSSDFGASVEWARCLGALGYPGFSHLKAQPDRNPAEFLVDALMQPDLDSRVAKGLPWLVFKYTNMNWDWLLKSAKLHDLQNRLGFTVTLARRVLEKLRANESVPALVHCEALLEQSRLAREDTFCHNSLTETEKRWLRDKRSPDARHWNLLTDLTAEQLTYVV